MGGEQIYRLLEEGFLGCGYDIRWISLGGDGRNCTLTLEESGNIGAPEQAGMGVDWNALRIRTA